MIRLCLFIQTLLPVLFYVFLCNILPLFLRKYSNIGPVRDGQPIFQGYYTDFLYWLMIIIAILMLFLTWKVLSRCWEFLGKEKFVLVAWFFASPFLMYLFIIFMQIATFGK